MNILFIPHVPNISIINRVYEFAKDSDSYFLSWEIDNSSFKHKIISQLKSFSFNKNAKIVQIPLLFKPQGLAVRFNTFMLNRLINSLKIDLVVNANALLFDIKSINVPVIYDLVDDHLEINYDIGLDSNRVKKIKQDIKNSRGIICVTSLLEEKVKELNKNTTTIENGLYMERFKNAKSLKKELMLEEKKVFGYIGGVDKWTGLKEAIENYLKIKDKDSAFIVVGGSDGSYFNNLKEKYQNDVLFIGKVEPSKVADYFKTIDIGLIPFYLNDFTNNALPIKALEYALGGASVISVPLRYLKLKQYPFIKFCEIDSFFKCLKEDKIDFSFDFKGYEWEVLTKKFLKFIEEYR